MHTYGKNGVVRFGGNEWSTIVCVNSITRMVTPPSNPTIFISVGEGGQGSSSTGRSPINTCG